MMLLTYNSIQNTSSNVDNVENTLFLKTQYLCSLFFKNNVWIKLPVSVYRKEMVYYSF